MFHFYNSLFAILFALLLLIGQWLRDQRCRRGWTIEYAAEKLGVSWTTLSRWERDKQGIHERNLYAITDIYDDSPLDLENVFLLPRATTNEIGIVLINQ